MKKKASPSASPKRVSMQDIANRLGVTRALVSMALRNSPGVAAATSKKIHATALEMGYRSNPLVRALMSEVRQRRKYAYQATLAFITNFETCDCWRKWNAYPDYFHGAQKGAQRLGYQVEHFWLGEYLSNPARLRNILYARGIPGVIIAPLPAEDHRFGLDLSGFSAVTFGYSLKLPHIPRVSNHHVHTVQLAVTRLAQSGYRRIGFVVSQEHLAQVNYLWRAGLQVSECMFPELEFTIFEGAKWTEAAFREWFRREGPEIVVAVSNEVWQWVQRLGLPIPEKLGFLHLDCLLGGEISGTYQNTESLGEAALNLIASLVEANIIWEDAQPRTLMLESDFNEGKTIRTRNA